MQLWLKSFFLPTQPQFLTDTIISQPSLFKSCCFCTVILIILAVKTERTAKEQVKTSSTSALLRSSVFRRQPREKVMAPATVAPQERSHSPCASFTRFWKGNFIFITTMAAAGRVRGLAGGRGEGEWRGGERRCCAAVCERRRRRRRGDEGLQWLNDEGDTNKTQKSERSPTAEKSPTENNFVRKSKQKDGEK